MNMWELQTRKYLSKVKKQAQIVEHMKNEINEIKELMSSVGSLGTDEKVQVSPTKDRIINELIQLDEKKIELAAACNAYEDFRIKVMNEIHKIPNEKQIEVLYKHYIEFKSLRVIAEEMHFDYSNVTMLRRKAISTFYRMNKDIIEKTVS